MLSIYFGKWDINDEKYINNMDSYFNFAYENEWINDDISRQIINDIDKSTVVKDSIINSDILGYITPERLSGGTKMLIIMNIEGNKNIYNGTNCGDNCSDWILRLSEYSDIIMDRCYLIQFTKESFKVKILNDNSIITNNEDLKLKYLEFRENTY